MSKLVRSVLLAAAAPLLGGCARELHATVLGPDQTEIVGEQCSRPNPPRHESVWQPGPAEVQQLEQDLPQLDALAPGSSPRLGDPKAYDRQYFGLLVQGRRLIYVNGFLEPMANKEWQQYAIVVCGGGTGAWGAVYDPASRRFSDFAFNGAR
ncbi:MAG: hypothetical protein JOY51_09030 [Nevskia sp.]|nr:hypothetical protein [Nevskia sp.]